MSHILKIAISLSVTAVVCALLVITARVNNVVDTLSSLGSVARSETYQATTTPEVADLAVLKGCNAGEVCGATLGSVVVLKTGTTDMTIYDATTSNVTLRSGATSTLRQVYIPASIAAGTYTFDMIFTNGILVDTSSNSASSTITYR